ncbi:MAG: undecaprenyl-phosphate glucose phosphotransferase [Flavobacteriales bacterium]
MKVKANKLRLLFSLGDIFHITLSLLLAYRITFYSLDLTDKYLFFAIIVNLSWLLIGYSFKLFTYESASRIEKMFSNFIKAVVFHALLTTSFVFALKTNTFSTDYLYYFFILCYLLLVLWRVFSIVLLKQYRKLGYNYKEVAIVGAVNEFNPLYQFFLKYENGFKLVAHFNPDIKRVKLNCPSYHISELEEFCSENNIDEIYFSDSLQEENILRDIMKLCDDSMIRLKIIPDFSAFKQRKVNIDFYGGIPVITLREEPLQDDVNRLLKRIFDILFSFLVIILILSWLIPLVGLIIKLTSPGPVFFIQKRSGLDNNEFNCFKFRTMSLNNMSDVRQAYKDDPRITRFGSFLRKSSLDEMPQFINVFLGDMSVVGPRPHMLKHTESYSKIINGYMVRQLVLPGITGAAQANGYRGETKTLVDMENRVKYDVWYIENWSLLLDIKLIILTIVNIFKGQKNAF